MTKAAAPAETGIETPRRYFAVAALSLGTAVTVLDSNVANVALPTMARDLHVDGSSTVLVITVYQLMLVMLLLPCAGLGDRIGLKRFYQYGQVLFIVATVMCFFANSLPFLLIARGLQAMGAAAAVSMMTAMIRHIYPKRLWGRGIATNAVWGTLAAASAPTIGGLIVSFGEWRYVFLLGAPLAGVSLWLGRRSLPDIPPVETPYNLGGALLNVATFGLFFFGLESAVHGDSPVVSAFIVLAGIVFAIWFVRHELNERRPILPLDLLARPVLALSCAAAFFAYMASMLQSISLPFRLQHLYGFSPGEVGAVLAPQPLAMMVISPVAGVMSDRIPPGILGAFGTLILCTALLLTAFPPAHPTYFDFAWRMALCGVGMSCFFAPNSRLMMSETPRERAAATGGLISTTRLTGQTLGATLVAALFAMGLGNSPLPMLVGASFALLAAVLSLSRVRLSGVAKPDSPPVDVPDL